MFAGPSISHEDVQATLEATCLPPAAQGDVYLASRKRPAVIALIDGVFEQVPSVWHKEILWAMTQGIHVYGASSMGALRAAELAVFGMEGVGWIYEAYRDGTLTDDDEVALVHGPAESGYEPLSEPMVNIRRTLDAAESGAVISSTTACGLVGIGKSLFYPDREYARILRQAHRQGLPVSELEALADWLPQGAVDQKRIDALILLHVIRERFEGGVMPKQVDFEFQWTKYWDRLVKGDVTRRPWFDGTEVTASGQPPLTQP